MQHTGGWRLLLGPAALIALVGLNGCSESEATPGFDPAPARPVDRMLELVGPCGAGADVAVSEDVHQIVVSAVWRAGNGEDCAAVKTVVLSESIGMRDLVDRDLQRRWVLVDDAWVSLDWCGVETRCGASDADTTTTAA